jgi:hypothetical protein
VARKFVKAILLLVGAEALAACSSTHPPSENGGLIREHNEAYSLLYKMMSDESKVDQIFALKHADDSVANVVKDIAAFCSVAKQKMDAFPKSDPHIEYDVADLPKLEQKARDKESDIDTKALLFSNGEKFEVRLLFTQAQAMQYVRNLASTLADEEDNPERKSFLNDMSHRCSDLYDRLMKLLTVKSQ